MKPITLLKLKAVAEQTFAEVTRLAQTSRPGCVQARKALRAAARHGLAERAYVVRDGMMSGWGGVAGGFRVEPLHGTQGGPRPGAGRPSADGAAGMRRVNVTLDALSDAIAKRAGHGDRSVGIRRALREWAR